MFVAEKISTRADAALSLAMAGNDLSWCGQILKASVRACSRSVPFSSANVVARVTFLSTVGMYAFCRGRRQISYDIFYTLHEFTNGRATWLDVMRECRNAQKSLQLSREFCQEVTEYFRENARGIMDFIDVMPGDFTLLPSQTARESERVASGGN